MIVMFLVQVSLIALHSCQGEELTFFWLGRRNGLKAYSLLQLMLKAVQLGILMPFSYKQLQLQPLILIQPNWMLDLGQLKRMIQRSVKPSSQINLKMVQDTVVGLANQDTSKTC